MRGTVSGTIAADFTSTPVAEAVYLIAPKSNTGGITYDGTGNYAFAREQSEENNTCDQWRLAALPTYQVTVSQPDHGAISPGGVVAVAQGRVQTFTFTPEAGYKLASVSVDGTPVTAVRPQNWPGKII